MAKKSCSDCGEVQRQINAQHCVKCGGTSFDYVNEVTDAAASDTYAVDWRKVPINQAVNQGVGSSKKSNASQVAIQSAKIVNAYGTYIQVFGIVIGVLTIIGGFFLAHQSGSSTVGWAGLMVGSVEIAIFAVQGALFRMISNYVIARLE